ncbi:MAG: hypothetical protein QM767_01810 [Anaeromyxobacter sp.]
MSSLASLPSCLSRSMTGPAASGETLALIVADSCPASSFLRSESITRPLAWSIALSTSERTFSTSSDSTGGVDRFNLERRGGGANFALLQLDDQRRHGDEVVVVLDLALKQFEFLPPDAELFLGFERSFTSPPVAMIASSRFSIASAAQAAKRCRCSRSVTSSAPMRWFFRSPMPRSFRTSVSSRSGGTRTVTEPRTLPLGSLSDEVFAT